MNADEKYLFDLNGYLVIKNVLTPEEVAIANEAIDRHSEQGRVRPRDQALDGGSSELKGEQGRGELGRHAQLGRAVVQSVPTHACTPDTRPLSECNIGKRVSDGSSDVPAFNGQGGGGAYVSRFLWSRF